MWDSWAFLGVKNMLHNKLLHNNLSFGLTDHVLGNISYLMVPLLSQTASERWLTDQKQTDTLSVMPAAKKSKETLCSQ